MSADHGRELQVGVAGVELAPGLPSMTRRATVGIGVDAGARGGATRGGSKRPRRGEDLADQGLEVRERLGGVVGVEAGLVPLVGELLGQGVPGLALVLVPGVGVLAQVLVVVPALEVLVRPIMW